MVFGLLSPTWRLGPRAVAALAPVWQAVRAMRAGRLPLESWLTVAGARAAEGGRAAGHRGVRAALVVGALRCVPPSAAASPCAHAQLRC